MTQDENPILSIIAQNFVRDRRNSVRRITSMIPIPLFRVDIVAICSGKYWQPGTQFDEGERSDRI